LLCALWGTSLAASAQSSASTWVPFDNFTPGTPATIQLDPGKSNVNHTEYTVTIHGFWREDVVGDDGNTYQRLDFPGLETMHTPGEPELPEARVLLAMATDASTVDFDGQNVLSQVFFSNIRPYPAPLPGEDEEIDPTGDPGPGDPDGSAEVFTVNSAIYNGTALWPAQAGADATVNPQIGPIAAASVAGNPVVWDPSSLRLIVAKQSRYAFDPAGLTPVPLNITKVQDKLFDSLYINWPVAVQAYPFEPFFYHSRYLIVAQPFWWDTLEPFVKMKKSQGYQVTVDTALPDVSSIRQVIADWYALGDPGMDHFCLLVGDTLTIPLGNVTAGGDSVDTDDVYGAIGTINSSKEVHVGRVSIDNEPDLAAQLQKIIDYQINPVPGGGYHTALLVAHEQNYPDKYSASHTKVLTQSYSNPPTFLATYGGTGGTNQQITNAVTAGQLGDGLGLVAYRGHGSTSAWTGWNLADENWHSNDVIALNNPVHPIVWAITCTNGNIDWGWGTSSDSIAEVWMEVPEGASASYAATRTTSTTPNHHLNEKLFKVVYDQGITTHGMAIAAAEASVWANWPGHKNPWAYLLLGDPSMTIRTEQASQLVLINMPQTTSMDDAGNETFVQALSQTGGPLTDGLLSYYKPSFLLGEDDEMSGAIWMDSSSSATLPFSFMTPGTLSVVIRDLAGNAASVDIPVTMGSAWTDLGNALGSTNGTPAMAGVGTLQPSSPVSLLVTGAAPLATAWLCFGATQLNAPFKGGVLVPDINPPGLILPVPTDGNGNLNLASTWPGGIPSGTDLVMQAWFADASGPVGFVATNGIVGRTP